MAGNLLKFSLLQGAAASVRTGNRRPARHKPLILGTWWRVEAFVIPLPGYETPGCNASTGQRGPATQGQALPADGIARGFYCLAANANLHQPAALDR